jgi:hypothetical protein
VVDFYAPVFFRVRRCVTWTASRRADRSGRSPTLTIALRLGRTGSFFFNFFFLSTESATQPRPRAGGKRRNTESARQSGPAVLPALLFICLVGELPGCCSSSSSSARLGNCCPWSSLCLQFLSRPEPTTTNCPSSPRPV